MKIVWVPERKPKNWVVCTGVTRWASGSSPWRSAWARSELSKMILLMYLTLVMLAKLLETSNELD